MSEQGGLTTINLFAARYSGTTWLALMLGAHPEAFCVGEPNSILRQGGAVCKIHGSGCELWSRYVHPSAENPFIQMRRLAGRSHLVLSVPSKFLDAQRDPRIEAKYVHLIRDGRAVVASMLRKGVCRSVREAVRLWKSEVRRSFRVMRRYAQNDYLPVRYESLAADPEGQVQRICAFLGLEYDPQMLEFWRSEQHYLGGNHGTLFSLMQKQNIRSEPVMGPDAQKVQWDLEYYRRRSAAPALDERWKRELTARQLRRFKLWGGRCNRKLGYAS